MWAGDPDHDLIRSFSLVIKNGSCLQRVPNDLETCVIWIKRRTDKVIIKSGIQRIRVSGAQTTHHRAHRLVLIHHRTAQSNVGRSAALQRDSLASSHRIINRLRLWPVHQHACGTVDCHRGRQTGRLQRFEPDSDQVARAALGHRVAIRALLRHSKKKPPGRI